MVRPDPAAFGRRLNLQQGPSGVEKLLPSRQGRILAAYLTLNRARAIGRDELIDALWTVSAPANAANALTVLLSKLHAVLGSDVLAGRSRVHLVFPDDARVDVEEAFAAVHRAESAVVLGSWARGWSAALSAQFIAVRPLMEDCDLPWIGTWQHRLDEILERALEAYGAACLGLGATELHAAGRAARRLLEGNPLRETGYRLLMQSLAARGNIAEALGVYEQARTILRDELGATPGPAIQEPTASSREPFRSHRRRSDDRVDRPSQLGVLCEHRGRDLVGVESARGAGVSLQVDEELDDVILRDAVAQRDPQLATQRLVRAQRSRDGHRDQTTGAGVKLLGP